MKWIRCRNITSNQITKRNVLFYPMNSIWKTIRLIYMIVFLDDNDFRGETPFEDAISYFIYHNAPRRSSISCANKIAPFLNGRYKCVFSCLINAVFCINCRITSARLICKAIKYISVQWHLYRNVIYRVASFINSEIKMNWWKICSSHRYEIIIKR